jgi:hypothetical protein
LPKPALAGEKDKRHEIWDALVKQFHPKGTPAEDAERTSTNANELQKLLARTRL